jgi:hypothetical protein
MTNYLPSLQTSIVITSANKHFHVKMTGGAGTEVGIDVAEATYNDMVSLCAQVEAEMTAHAAWAGFTWDVSIGTTGLITIQNTDAGHAGFQLHFADASGTLHPLLGYTSTDKTGGYSYTAEYRHQFAYYHPWPLGDDTWEIPDRSADPDITIADSGLGRRLTNPNDPVRRGAILEFIPENRWHPDKTEGGAGNTFVEFWKEASKGTPVRFYSHTDTWVLAGTYLLIEPAKNLLQVRRMFDRGCLYYGPVNMVFHKTTAAGV